ncbi:MAG: peptide-methionine (S)-S-oxide reductase [Flavobacteriaceae bacterium]|nr:peptide-methionine (S)-S-oxide reductase [Flavobacteriaceae bacterium]
MKTIYIFLSLIILNNCQLSAPVPQDRSTEVWAPTTIQSDKSKAYFASGCFWCVESVYESIKGVEEAYSGYAGGKTKNPTYYQVVTGRTGHAETVEVIYDPKLVNFSTLVEVFFDSHDPTLLNQQGPDRGTHYRSIAFYQKNEEKEIIEKYIAKLKKEKIYNRKIVTEIKPLVKFYYAEKHHQDYEKNNPNDLYILNVSVPRLNNFKATSPELIKDQQH